VLEVLPKANAAGVKLVLGDDYGAMGFPHGRYAHELEVYVRDAGIAPLDVLRWATVHGAELMGRGHELGRITDGYLADLLVVDGDPSRDVTVLQDPANLVGIMKGGTWHKEP
jgi:imidazolonepropionase-like amidohydrolase